MRFMCGGTSSSSEPFDNVYTCNIASLAHTAETEPKRKLTSSIHKRLTHARRTCSLEMKFFQYIENILPHIQAGLGGS